MKHISEFTPDLQSQYDADLHALDAAKHDWARLPVDKRIALLQAVKDALMQVAEGWATTAARKKRIPAGSPLVGEEWISGPYALMAGCNGLMETLSKMEGKSFLKSLDLGPPVDLGRKGRRLDAKGRQCRQPEIPRGDGQ